VCASRIGLWVFDISVTQLMQEFIPDGVRGIVGGTQQAFNAFFMLLTFALGLVFPDPREFHIYVAAGYTAVGLAAVLYALGVYRRSDGFLMSSEKVLLHESIVKPIPARYFFPVRKGLIQRNARREHR